MNIILLATNAIKYLRIHKCIDGGALSITTAVVENGNRNPSSNPGCGCLHFCTKNPSEKREIPMKKMEKM